MKYFKIIDQLFQLILFVLAFETIANYRLMDFSDAQLGWMYIFGAWHILSSLLTVFLSGNGYRFRQAHVLFLGSVSVVLVLCFAGGIGLWIALFMVPIWFIYFSLLTILECYHAIITIAGSRRKCH